MFSAIELLCVSRSFTSAWGANCTLPARESQDLPSVYLQPFWGLQLKKRNSGREFQPVYIQLDDGETYSVTAAPCDRYGGRVHYVHDVFKYKLFAVPSALPSYSSIFAHAWLFVLCLHWMGIGWVSRQWVHLQLICCIAFCFPHPWLSLALLPYSLIVSLFTQIQTFAVWLSCIDSMVTALGRCVLWMICLWPGWWYNVCVHFCTYQTIRHPSTQGQSTVLRTLGK